MESFAAIVWLVTEALTSSKMESSSGSYATSSTSCSLTSGFCKISDLLSNSVDVFGILKPINGSYSSSGSYGLSSSSSSTCLSSAPCANCRTMGSSIVAAGMESSPLWSDGEFEASESCFFVPKSFFRMVCSGVAVVEETLTELDDDGESLPAVVAMATGAFTDDKMEKTEEVVTLLLEVSEELEGGDPGGVVLKGISRLCRELRSVRTEGGFGRPVSST